MSGALILAVGLVYVYIAADQGLKGNPGMAIAYAGYAFSNIGLWLLSK